MAKNIPTPPIITETVEATPGLNPYPTSLTMSRGGLRPIEGSNDENINPDFSKIAQTIKKEFPAAAHSTADETQTSYGAPATPGEPGEGLTP